MNFLCDKKTPNGIFYLKPNLNCELMNNCNLKIIYWINCWTLVKKRRKNPPQKKQNFKQKLATTSSKRYTAHCIVRNGIRFISAKNATHFCFKIKIQAKKKRREKCLCALLHNTLDIKSLPSVRYSLYRRFAV